MHVVYSFPHALGRSGIGTTALHQVQGAAQLGLSVTLFCASLDVPLDPRVRVIRTLQMASLRMPHRAIGVQRAYQWHDRVVAAWLRRNHEDVDVVHVWPAGCVRTLRTAATLAVPSTREVPNTHTAHAFEIVARELANLRMAPIKGHSHTATAQALAREEYEYRLAGTLLVPSEYSKGTFLARGFAEERLRLHQYGFDPRAFPQTELSTGRQPGDGLRAVFLGRCEPRKGLHHGLRAWLDSGAASRGQLVICGTFVPGYAAALGEAIKHPSVVVRPFDPEPARLLGKSDVLLLPSMEEGSALVTYEAQASGCGLVVSDAAGARATDGLEALIHRAGDVSRLTQQLGQLTRDPGMVVRLRRAALSNRATLTWDRAAQSLVAAYEETVALGGGRLETRRPG